MTLMTICDVSPAITPASNRPAKLTGLMIVVAPAARAGPCRESTPIRSKRSW
jgi:hypothetical protein